MVKNLTVKNMIIGEIPFVGTKGLFFNLAYMIIFTVLFGSMAIRRLTRRIVN